MVIPREVPGHTGVGVVEGEAEEAADTTSMVRNLAIHTHIAGMYVDGGASLLHNFMYCAVRTDLCCNVSIY